MDKMILSYHDSCLYQSDYIILKSDSWLNDRIINFYFEFLQNEIYHNHNILFIGPEVTQAIKLTGNSADVNAIFLNHLDPLSKSLIIFAVNNHSDSEVAGGSHWSCCVYSKSDNAFFHFDSFSGSNKSACSSIVKILKSCLKYETAELVHVPCLQQNNSHDCGVFLLCHTDLVCETAVKGESICKVQKIKVKEVDVKRNELIKVIQNLGGNVQ